MSDYHVLRKATDNSSCSVAIHLPSPEGHNLAGRSWNAVIRLGSGGNIVVPRLQLDDPDEFLALKKGSKIEDVQTVTFSNVDLTDAQRKAEIEAVVTQAMTDIADTDSDLYKERVGIFEWYLYREDI